MARIINNDAVVSLQAVYSVKSNWKSILTRFGAIACRSARKTCRDNCGHCPYTMGRHGKYFRNVNFGDKTYTQIKVVK